jgi:hypothetical protein
MAASGPPRRRALKAEARRRVAAGEFFGHIAYLSVIARPRAAGLTLGGARYRSSASSPSRMSRATRS